MDIIDILYLFYRCLIIKYSIVWITQVKYTFRQLEIFIRIAETGSVSRAAEALALSQSATSTALGELEKQFDCKLFDRTGKRLHLNEMGRLLLPKALALLDRGNEIQHFLEDKQLVGRTNVGAAMTIGNYLVTMFIGIFMRQYPGSEFKLKVQNTQDIVEQIASFQLDLGFIEGHCQHPDILVEHWIDDELTVFCAPDHPLATQKTVSIKRLMQQDWIMREPESNTRQTLERALPGAVPVPRLELGQTEGIKRAVESGLGISCISKLALRDAFRRGSLVPIKTPALNLTRTFSIIRHQNKSMTPGMKAFLDLCHTMTADTKSSNDIDLPFVP